MGEVAVESGRQSPHPYEVESHTQPQRRRGYAGPKRPEGSEMHE